MSDDLSFFPLAQAASPAEQLTLCQQALAAAQARVVALEQQVLELQARACIAEQNPNPIVQLASTGDLLYANPAAAPLLLALAGGAWVQQEASQLSLPSFVQHSLRMGEQQELTVAGEHYLATAVAGTNDAHTTLYLTTVTAHQQGQQQLVEQRTFYETILAHVPANVIVFDAEHRYLYVNPSVEPDAALRAWMIGKDNFESCARRGRPRAMAEQRQALFEQALRERREVTWEEDWWLPELGKRHHLRRYWPVFASDGTVRMMLSLGIDITERQQAEVALQEHQQFIQQIVDTIPNLLCVINADNRVVFANAAFKAIFQDQDSASVLPPEQRRLIELFCVWNQQVLETQQVLRREISLLSPDGQLRYFQTHKQPLQRADGSFEVLTLHTDITARVAGEQALQHAKQQAEDNARAKETFLSRMSHEIRTPLNGLLGVAMLLDKTPLSAQQQGYLTAMQQAGQQLLALINDVLDLSKITSRPQPLVRAPFDLLSALLGAQQTVAALATLKGLPVTVVANEVAGLRVVGDADRLHQVLLNLLGNAVKFTERGQIHLGAAVVCQTSEDVTVRFWVQDTGFGIAPEEQEGIFEAFTQVNAATPSLGGTGLGLAISEQLVGQMGGMLRVSSVLGQGSTFFFVLTLPRSEEAVATAPPEPIKASYEELQGLRVLLAEDNMVNQWIATVVLEQWGVVVDAVDNGQAALAALETHTYDAAVLDIQMPGLTGLEVTKALRQLTDPVRANLPVIALTANAFEADQASYLAAGMNGCVTKPFEESTLCELLLELTGRQPIPN